MSRPECCSPLDVWGTRTNANGPNGVTGMPCIVQSNTLDQHESLVPYDAEGQSENSTVLDPSDWENGVGKYKEITPNLWNVTPQSFTISAVKVPSSFPYSLCDGEQYTDSSKLSEGPFEVQIGILSEHKESPDPESTLDYVWDLRYCFKSRCIYIDGVQRYVMYVLGGSEVPPFGDISPWKDDTMLGALEEHCDHVLVDIVGQTQVATYYVSACNDMFTAPGDTAMEVAFCSFFPPDTQRVGGIYGGGFQGERAGKQYAVNCESFGVEFYLTTNYSPANAGNGVRWGFSRVEYVAPRLGEELTNGVPSMQVYSTASNSLGPVETLAEGETYVNPYVAVLPSRRVYINSLVEPHDECHVVAISHTVDEENPAKMVCGQILNDDFRVGVGGEDFETGLWDGTLREDEVQTVIFPTAQTDEDFPGEPFENPIVRSYIHKDGKDLVLFTVSGDQGVIGPVLIDFEDGTVNGSIPDGLPDFEITGSPNGGWSIEAPGLNSSSYKLHADINAEFAGQVDVLHREIMAGGTFSLRFHMDNSARSGAFPTGTPLNFPVPENYMAIYDNGVRRKWYNGTAESDSGADFITRDEFDAEYVATFDLEPGIKHTIRVEVVRAIATGYNDLIVNIDDWQYEEVLLGDDINGKRRYFHDGDKVYRHTDWDWAQRDKDAKTPLSSRADTNPDCIMSDDEGGILISNPHSVQRFISGVLDLEFFDQGYKKFTASPANTITLGAPCYNPGAPVVTIDQTLDPPWGANDIPIAKNGKIQLRAMNAAMRDATDIMIPMDGVYDAARGIKEEYQVQLQAANNTWSSRASCWTLYPPDKKSVPHVQLINRVHYRLPAYPAGPWTHPPFTSDFGTWDHQTGLYNEETEAQLKYSHIRIRDDRYLEEEDKHTRWSNINWIVARDYSNCYTEPYQFVWLRQFNDPPSPMSDPDSWDPDTFPPDALNHGPWASSFWMLVQAYQSPVGFRLIDPRLYQGSGIFVVQPFNELCPDDPVDPPKTSRVGNYQFHSMWLFTDFDAVDCDCDCCIEGSGLIPVPRQPGRAVEAPTGFNVTGISEFSILLEWTNNDAAQQGVIVARKTSAGWQEIRVNDPGAVNYTWSSGLAPASRYTFRVRAFTTTGDVGGAAIDGLSEWTNEDSDYTF